MSWGAGSVCVGVPFGKPLLSEPGEAKKEAMKGIPGLESWKRKNPQPRDLFVFINSPFGFPVGSICLFSGREFKAFQFPLSTFFFELSPPESWDSSVDSGNGESAAEEEDFLDFPSQSPSLHFMRFPPFLLMELVILPNVCAFVPSEGPPLSFSPLLLGFEFEFLVLGCGAVQESRGWEGSFFSAFASKRAVRRAQEEAWMWDESRGIFCQEGIFLCLPMPPRPGKRKWRKVMWVEKVKREAIIHFPLLSLYWRLEKKNEERILELG